MNCRRVTAVWLPIILLLSLGCPSPKIPQKTEPTVNNASRFRDVAEESRLIYRWQPPGKPPLNILQTIGNGCAFLDYDNDGNLDALLVGPKPGLFRGDGNGKFIDVSASVLGGLSGYFLGVAVGDIDGDGFSDIYLSGYREGRLLQNQRGKSFRDITAASGLNAQPWGTSCGFADIDSDGKLDLYVGNYADFGPETQPQLCKIKTKNGDVMTSCGPKYYTGLPGVLSKNNGAGKFTDVTKAWGMEKQTGRTLGVAFLDLENTGRASIALANDEAPGDFFVNKSPGKLENQADVLGTAYDRDGNKHGGMGTDVGDYDNDGKFDLAVATFSNEIKNLYRNDGALFTDQSPALGLGGKTTAFVAFGLKLFDADNDGWLDLMIANGHVQDNIDLIEATTYRQPIQFFQNTNTGKQFIDASETALAGLSKIVGRGLAVGDYDNDGKLDVLIVDMDGKPLLLHNETKTSGNWIGFTLPPDAWGATLTLEASGKKLVRQCQPCSSYLSSSDPRVHFGLGNATKIDRLTVHWPDGKTETLTINNINQYRNLRHP
jgi:enediyne biosynthesis protein E4